MVTQELQCITKDLRSENREHRARIEQLTGQLGDIMKGQKEQQERLYHDGTLTVQRMGNGCGKYLFNRKLIMSFARLTHYHLVSGP